MSQSKRPQINRPSSVSIVGKNYAINYIPEIASADLELEDQEEGFAYIFGLTLNDRKEIQVRDDLDNIEEVDTVVHEVFHMLDFIFDLDMSERQVKVLATTYLALLRDNPGFAEYVNQLNHNLVGGKEVG